jgi:hypothetical protein
MRPMILSLCVLTAACSGQALDSATRPSPVISSPGAPSAFAAPSPNATVAPAQALGGTPLPFRGSMTTFTDVPPPFAHATAEGNATHLGRFTATMTATVTAGSTSTGTFIFTAANGDQLSGTFVGSGVFIPPVTARITEVATIEGGTGRFASATGTFTMERAETIDFATGQGTGSGSLEGQITLNK